MTENLPAIQGFDQQSVADMAGQLMPRSRRIYMNDAKAFAVWIADQGLTPRQITRSHAIAYRSFLIDKYAKATAQRMLSVARRIMQEQVHAGAIVENPFRDIKGWKSADETTHTALDEKQADELLKSIDRSTKRGLRDYALILLLLRTGIRRAECVALNVNSITQEQGHNIIVIEHGKGDKRRIAKLPVDVRRCLDAYIETCNLAPDSPLFVRFYKSDKPAKTRLSDKAVEQMVIQHAQTIGIDLTPHGLRASFVTLSLEKGAKLEQVQYAAGHQDPRTTERYQRRKLNLDDNAVDYIKIKSAY